MSSEEIVIDVRNLSKRYEIYNTPQDRLKQLIIPFLQNLARRVFKIFGVHKFHQTSSYYREFWALRDVSFQIRRGETFGIIGRNGSGKSTLLQMLAGTLTQTSGDVTVNGNGRIAALLELGSGFNPEFSGRENVLLNGQILGLSQKEIEARYNQIVEFADIGEFIDQPVKTYSSGMFVRLAFAVQAHIDASIVIIDEALAVGDVFFRQKCYARLEQLRNSGAVILLVSHSMTDIEQFCERALLLDHGAPVFTGPASQASKHYYFLNQEKGRISEGKDNIEFSVRDGGGAHQLARPPLEAFLDIVKKVQINNGQAICTGVGLCNAAGEPCNSFTQGDKAEFYYEFELIEAIDIPICGVVIKSDKGVIVHGKNSWQYDGDVPSNLLAGYKVQCKQEVALQLAPGEYTFEIGFASVSLQTWLNRESISDSELFLKATRICIIADAGSFSVGYATSKGNVSILTHHGIANLPGEITIAVERADSKLINQSHEVQ